MRRLGKLSLGQRFAILVPLLAVLVTAFLYLQGWPTLTATAALRRMERAHLVAPGQVVVQGSFSYQGRPDGPVGNHWMVTQDTNGNYIVVTLERFWGLLWRPAPMLEFCDVSQMLDNDHRLTPVSVGFESFRTEDGALRNQEVFLLFSQDDTIARLAVTKATLPETAFGDPVPYIEAHGTTADCTQVAPGIWQGQVSFSWPTQPTGGRSSAPWTIIRGYDASGALVYEKLPQPNSL